MEIQSQLVPFYAPKNYLRSPVLCKTSSLLEIEKALKQNQALLNFPQIIVPLHSAVFAISGYGFLSYELELMCWGAAW